jgi:dTDP-4-dehydrorhamnose reductase
MQKIYITGAAGMLGYYLYNAFSNEFVVYGCDLVELDRKIASDNISILNLTDFENVENELLKIAPEIIIHTAALIDVNLCEKERSKAFLINADVTENLVRIADKINARLIYISTDAVFDGKNERAYNEGDKVNPINVYGESKLKGEKFVLKGQGNNVILRTNIYGWNVQNKISFAEWVYFSLKEKKEITMYTDIHYSPIYVGDLFLIIKKIVNSDLKGVYHVGGESCTKYDFAMALAEEFSFSSNCINEGSFKAVVSAAPRSPNMMLDSTRIKRELNIPIPDLRNGLKHFREDAEKYEKL